MIQPDLCLEGGLSLPLCRWLSSRCQGQRAGTRRVFWRISDPSGHGGRRLDRPDGGRATLPEGVHWIRDFLTDLARQGRTVLVSSHLLAEMSLMASDLVIIGAGRLIARTTVAELTRAASGSWVEVRGPEASRLAAALAHSGAAVTGMAATGGEDGRLKVVGLDAPPDRQDRLSATAGAASAVRRSEADRLAAGPDVAGACRGRRLPGGVDARRVGRRRRPAPHHRRLGSAELLRT